MQAPMTTEPSRPARRRHDAAASRQALLDAATALFDERGYDVTTVRDIGVRAAVDPALIARYFGGKEGLYLATLAHAERPPLPSEPRALLRELIERNEEPGAGPIPRAMVSATLSASVLSELREMLDVRVLRPLAAELSGEGDQDDAHARLRAELLVAIAMGVTLTRANGSLEALQRATPAELDAVLGPLVDALR